MFENMRYVYEVYKEASFSKAAQNLYISQPSLSAMVKKIEARIGAPIFDRSNVPICLTEEGKEYIRCVEEVMEIESRFSNYINDVNELKMGNLSIGGSNYFTSYVMPSIISRFTQRYPLIDISIIEANTQLLSQKILDGTLDLILDNYSFDEKYFEKYPYCIEHILLVVPKKYVPEEASSDMKLTAGDVIKGKHMMDATPTVGLKQFSESPFMFLRSGNDTRERADRICQNQNFNPRIILKLDQQITAYNLACYGMGITFVSDLLVKKVQPDERVLFFKIDDEEARREVSFYHKKGKMVTRVMEEFLKLSIEKTISNPYTAT